MQVWPPISQIFKRCHNFLQVLSQIVTPKTEGLEEYPFIFTL